MFGDWYYYISWIFIANNNFAQYTTTLHPLFTLIKTQKTSFHLYPLITTLTRPPNKPPFNQPNRNSRQISQFPPVASENHSPRFSLSPSFFLSLRPSLVSDAGATKRALTRDIACGASESLKIFRQEFEWHLYRCPSHLLLFLFLTYIYISGDDRVKELFRQGIYFENSGDARITGRRSKLVRPER